MTGRVLIVAEAANPEWTSVPLVGFAHADALLRATDAHVVTQIRNRDALVRAGWREDVDFTALDTEYVARPIHLASERIRALLGLGFTFDTATSTIAYYAFERALWARFGDRIRAKEFDLVHRITPLTPTAPSRLASLCARHGVPFVLGPLNGGAPWPTQFRDRQREEGDLLSRVRGGYRLLPGHRSTLRDASAIVAGARFVVEQLPVEHRDKCVLVPENGVDPRRFDREVSRPRVGPLRVAFLGRLVPYKGCDMLLDAIAPMARAGDAVLDVIGDGPEHGSLVERAASLGIADRVRFHGFVPHAEVGATLLESDVLALPSIREFGGGVVLEAMMLGVVPIVVDYAGPTELVTRDSGIRVPLGGRETIVSGFARALAGARAMGDELRAMGRRARARVLSSFTWDAKAAQMLAVHRFARGLTPKPLFGLVEGTAL